MNAQELKFDLMQWLENLNDLRTLQQLAALKEKLSATGDATRQGEPFTEAEFVSRIEAARSRIKNGQFTTMEELEKEMEGW